MMDYILEKDTKEMREKLQEKFPALFLKDLFDMITERELNKVIVDEIESRKTIFLCACGMWVKNCTISSYNLLVNDIAGAGKDYITSKTLSILPDNYLIKRTRISPTVFTYWHNSKYEPAWTWDNKTLYLEDISSDVMNSPVFKVMCSSGSHATIVKDQKAIDIVIKGKPVMIITSATANPNPELTRRFTILNLDSGIDQTKAIVKRHLKYAVEGKTPKILEDIKESLYNLKRIEVKIPYAAKLESFVPMDNVIMRTHILRFLDYIKASCALYQFQREMDEDGYYIATEQDYQVARIVMNKICSNQYMIPLTKDQRMILEVFEKLGENTWWTVAELEPRLSFISERWLRKQLDKLVKYGLLSKDLQSGEKKNLMIYGYNNIESIELPTSLE